MKKEKILTSMLVASMMLSMGTTAFANEVGMDTSNNEIVSTSEDPEVLAGLKSAGAGSIEARTITYEVTGNGVRLRAPVSTSGKILGTLNAGDLVNEGADEPVCANGYLWSCVYSYKHECWGWVADDYLVDY